MMLSWLPHLPKGSPSDNKLFCGINNILHIDIDYYQKIRVQAAVSGAVLSSIRYFYPLRTLKRGQNGVRRIPFLYPKQATGREITGIPNRLIPDREEHLWWDRLATRRSS